MHASRASTCMLQQASADVRCVQTPAVLKLLYDEDLVEEEYMQAWSSKPTAAKVLEVRTPDLTSTQLDASWLVLF